MCGISGIVSNRLPPQTLEPTIKRMSRSIAHRGPDGTHVRCFGPPTISQYAALGHNRLSIIDLSEAATEPMTNEDGSLWLVFNGEIYNFQDLRARLEHRGHRFRSRTDAEVILHLYEDIGPECVAELDGIFAFAILDLNREVLFLARDPIGVKPLFYVATSDHFLFASEIKAILASSLVTPVMNRQAISDFFTFLYVPGPETAFEGIRQLAPAHSLVFRLVENSVSTKPYWEVPSLEDTEHSSYEVLRAQIRERLTAAVKRQLISDVPLGVFLSGGIDSTIVAGLAKQEKSDLRTYTLTMPGEEYRFYDESESARAVSRHLGTDHVEIPLYRPDLKMMLDLVEFSDQPFANPTVYLMHELSRNAREHITVAMCGAGGDELFAGYPRSAAQRLAKRLRWVPRPALKSSGQLLRLVRDSHRDPRLRRARKFLSGLDSDSLVQYLNWTYFLNESQKHRLLQESRPEHAGPNGLHASVEVLRAVFDQCTAPDPGNRMLQLDLKTFLVDNVLEYTDRMSMASALEVRVPMLDRSFVELSLNTPFAYKIRGAHAKAILVDAFAEFFPRRNRGVPKRGFNAPLGLWMGRFLNDYFDASLDSTHSLKRQLGDDIGSSWIEGPLDFTFIQELRAEHREGEFDRSHELFACMIFDVWWRKYIRKSLPLVHC